MQLKSYYMSLAYKIVLQKKYSLHKKLLDNIIKFNQINQY